MRKITKLSSICIVIIASIFLFMPYTKVMAITIGFYTEGGSFVESQILEEGEKVSRPENPVWDGYVFAGWYQDDTFNTSFDFDAEVDTDIILFAKWLEIVPEARVYVTLPRNGYSPVSTGTSDESDKYIVSSVSYYQNDEYLEDNALFAAETEYEIYVTITPVNTYTIDPNVTLMQINNYDATFFGYSGKSVVYKISHVVPADNVTQISVDKNSAYFYELIEGFTKEDSDNNIITVRITNTGSTNITIDNTNPVSSGPFGTYWYANEELEPNEFIDVNLRIAESSSFANQPNYYEGTYLFTATNVNNVQDTYELEIPTSVNILAYEEHTITFNSNGGSEVEAVTAYTGEFAPIPEKPTKDGYIFAGWFTDAELECEFDLATNPVYDDITLFAKWTEAVTITFVNEEGNPMEPLIVAKGTRTWEIDVTPTNNDSNKYLAGIKINNPENDFAGFEELYNLTFDEDTTIYFYWEDKTPIEEINLVFYSTIAGWDVGKYKNDDDKWEQTITPNVYPAIVEENYGVDGQEFILDNELFVGTIEANNEYYIRGRIFVWNDAYTFNNTTLENINIPNATITDAHLEGSDIIFTAKFTATYFVEEHDDEITITFDTNGGNEIEAITRDWGEGITLPIPEKDGFEFGGWVILDEEQNEVAFYEGGTEEYFNHSETLVAKWYANENRITAININLELPFDGEEIAYIEKHDEWGSWQEINRYPDASVNEENAHYHISGSEWIDGACNGDCDYVDNFIGTFVVGEDYYAMIYIDADDDYFMKDDVLDNILVNGVAPEEVFPIYNKKYTMIIAKVKAVKEFNNVRFMDGEDELLNINVRYNEKVNEPENILKGQYIIDAWCQDDTLALPYDFNTAVTNDLTLYAKWKLEAIEEYDDIVFDLTWNNTYVNTFINDKGVMEESDDFTQTTFTYQDVIVENAGYTSADKNNTIKLQVRFGDQFVTKFIINGIEYTEESDSVEISDDAWFITVPGAEKYIISGTGDATIPVPRTIIWANVDADNSAENYDEDMLLEHGKAKVVAIYNEDDVKVAGEAEADDSGMGWVQVSPGNKVVFEFVPEYGYQLTGVSVNGMPLDAQDAMNQYIFEMPNTNVHFSATFTKVDDSISVNSDKVTSGNIKLGNTLDGGSAQLTISDVELSSDKIKDFEKAAGNYTLASYLDIDLYNVYYKGKNDASDVWSTKISELDKEATITIKLADDVDVSNIVLVHNVHDGDTYEIIEIEAYDETEHTITFKTKSFSNYAIALKNTANTNTNDTTVSNETTNATNNTNTNGTNPITSDNIGYYILILIVSVVGVSFGLIKIKKHHAKA